MKCPTGSLDNVTPMDPSSLKQSDGFEIHLKGGRSRRHRPPQRAALEHLVLSATGPDTKGIEAEVGRLAIQANSKEGGYHFRKISIKPLP